MCFLHIPDATNVLGLRRSGHTINEKKYYIKLYEVRSVCVCVRVCLFLARVPLLQMNWIRYEYEAC